MRSPVVVAFGSALSNAREATQDIARAVYERAVLTRSLDLMHEGPEAGTLTRLPRAEALSLLSRGRIGRMAYVARAGMPDVVPVNYRLAGDCILVSTGPGPKLQAADRREMVAFEVDEFDAPTQTGWSVVVHGVATRLSPQERQLQERTHGTPQPWAAGPRHEVIRIAIARLDARRLH